MTRSVIHRGLGVLAGSLALAAVAHATPAQAVSLTITSPVDHSYSNDPEPTVSFTGAQPDHPVTLTSSDTSFAGETTTSDSNGDGSFTPTAPVVASGPNTTADRLRR